MERIEKINKLAEVIRQVDGNHTMGAASLAEAIVDSLSHDLTATRATAIPTALTPTGPVPLPPVGSVVVTGDPVRGQHVLIRRSTLHTHRQDDGSDRLTEVTSWDNTNETRDHWATDSQVAEWLASGHATVLRFGETMVMGVVPRDSTMIERAVDAMRRTDDSGCPLSLATAIVDTDGWVIDDDDVNPPVGSVVATMDQHVLIRRSETRTSRDEDGTPNENIFTSWDSTDERMDRFEVDRTVREWLASGYAIMLRCGVTPVPPRVPHDLDSLRQWLSSMSRVDRYRVASLIANRATGSRLSAYTDAEVYAETVGGGGIHTHPEVAELFGMTVDMVHARCTRHRRRLGIVKRYARRDRPAETAETVE